jgi:hypothetical protein
VPELAANPASGPSTVPWTDPKTPASCIPLPHCLGTQGRSVMHQGTAGILPTRTGRSAPNLLSRLIGHDTTSLTMGDAAGVPRLEATPIASTDGVVPRRKTMDAGALDFPAASRCRGTAHDSMSAWRVPPSREIPRQPLVSYFSSLRDSSPSEQRLHDGQGRATDALTATLLEPVQLD